MSFIGKAIGKLTGADSAAKGAERAAQTQSAAAQAGIVEQQRQFDALQQVLAPYRDAGIGALSGQQNLLGLNGNDAQAQAIGGIQSSPEFTTLLQQGENSLLQNASATGGLRGGNLQQAMMQFSPQLLNQLIQQRYSNLGGLTALGQNAAAGTGNAGMQTGSNIAGLLQQQGAATAGGQLARAGVAQQGFGTALQLGTAAAAIYGLGGLGGGGAAGANFPVANPIF